MEARVDFFIAGRFGPAVAKRARTAKAPKAPAKAEPAAAADEPPAAPRKRKITMALRAYAALTTSAAKGAVRVVPDVE